ncbi:hypothetical protein [Streptomyces alkaliphilus]|uniref:hypothetical protein n=1 Tax=Streptomyces alkaliphilus TaxID=1472722 RepID=UPI00117CA713|nr:hypothetical protein [Streptomyces alkaliphilus]MQS06410.1 hypothetical protein [Streptomyces alkaliphilus]
MTYRLPAILAAGVATLLLSACAGPSDETSSREAASAAGMSEENEEPAPETSQAPEPAESTEPGSPGNIADLPAEDVMSMMLDSLIEMDTVRLTAVSGHPDEGFLILESHFDQNGNCIGDLTMPSGASIHFISVSGEAWTIPDEAFWVTIHGESDEPFPEALKGKYIREEEAHNILDLCSVEIPFSGFFEPFLRLDTSAYSVGDTGIHNGIPVVTLHAETASGPAEMLIATDGPPLPLKLVGPEDGTVYELGDFNSPLDVSPPPAHMVAG